MENASKALIIAGAILLSILLISLGILIYTQAQDTVSNSGMDETSINAFNNKLVKYEGSNVKGSMVKNLIAEVNAINSSKGNNGAHISVKLSGVAQQISSTATPLTSNTAEGITYKTNNIQNTQSYTVEVETFDDAGRVKEMKITQNS